MERFYAPLWGLRKLGIIRFSVELVMLFLLNLIVRSVTGLRKGINQTHLYASQQEIPAKLETETKDCPFKLDYLTDLCRYVDFGHYQTTFDDKSGYDHVRLHPRSSTFFGLQWEGWYFTFFFFFIFFFYFFFIFLLLLLLLLSHSLR